MTPNHTLAHRLDPALRGAQDGQHHGGRPDARPIQRVEFRPDSPGPIH